MSTHRGLASGRFSGEADPLFRAFNDSLRFDRALVRHDIAGSIAWARAICGAGVLTTDERDRLIAALRELDAAVSADDSAIRSATDEDVHSWVEARLIEKVGALGKKLHTGRSRNDQVATDLRLYVREELSRRIAEVRAAQRALVDLARREIAVVIPGFTHLQHAQPVLAAHWAMAYFHMLDRDADRMIDALKRVNICPLGSAALAGTTYPVDRVALARDLGFATPSANSLDAVADRDFALESLAALAGCALHLSRLAEDLIIYASQPYGYIELSDAVTSGSSLMPQKKNPDALELIRGKTGRIIGAQVALATVLKGLPLAYNKDMQEDKEPVFDAMESLSMCLRMLVRVLEGAAFRRDVCERSAMTGYTNATELADYLVAKGVPFREAHDISGRVVRAAIAVSKPIEGLSIAELRAHDARIDADVYVHLTAEYMLKRRDVPGGTAPARVAEAIESGVARLAACTRTDPAYHAATA